MALAPRLQDHHHQTLKVDNETFAVLLMSNKHGIHSSVCYESTNTTNPGCVMLEPALIGLFFLSSLLLALSPGPDNLFVLSKSATQGPIAGIVITMGLCTGLLMHTLFVSLGLAAMLKASPNIYTVIRFLGAAYLLYLAWENLKAIRLLTENTPGKLSMRKLYFRGVIMNISNPKVAIFFLSFFPQFTNPAVGNITTQIALLGLLFILAAAIVFSAISMTGITLRTLMEKRPNIEKMLHYLTSLIFILLAIRIVID